MPSDYELVVEIVRRKLSRDVLQSQSIHSRFVASVEAVYNEGPSFQTKTQVLSSGTTFYIPWSDKLQSLMLTLFTVDGVLTTLIGFGDILIADDSNPLQTCDIIHNSQERVGKLFYHTYVSQPYNDENKKREHRRYKHSGTERSQFDEMQKRDIPPEFRFQKLGRRVNWYVHYVVIVVVCEILFCCGPFLWNVRDKVRSINLDRVVRTADASLLMTCLDDVAVGDVSQEG